VDDSGLIGRVLRASTTGYACGMRGSEITTPYFGAFVYTEHDESLRIIGLIYAIRIDDDPLVRQLIMANNLTTAAIRDQRENRMIPVEISIVNIGYQVRGDIYQALPPRPPLSLDPVYLCDADTVIAFTENADFFRLILNTSEVPAEELLAAAVKNAALARHEREQRDFLVRSGRRLAQLLSGDLPRLNHLLRLIKP